MTALTGVTTPRHAPLPADRAVDDALVAREPALPALAVLLDDERLSELLRSHGWLAPGETASVDRLRLKPGTRVQAGIRTHPQGRWLSAGGFTTAGLAKVGKERQVARRRGHPTLVRPDLLLVVSSLTADRDLPALPGLRPDDDAGPRRRAAVLLREVLAAGGVAPAPGQRLRTATIAYNPARRWVGALHRYAVDGGARPWANDAPCALVKVHADPRTAQRSVAVADLLTRIGVAGPRTVALSGSMVGSTWWPGRPADPTSASDATLVADLMARVAAVRPGQPGPGSGSGGRSGSGSAEVWERRADLPRLDHATILEHARAATRALGVLDPGAGLRAVAVLDRVAPSLANCLEDPVLVHGDLSGDQVVMGADGPVLIDLDRAAAGPRGWDAASWMAAQASLGVPPQELLPLPDTAVPAALLAAAALLRTPEPWRRRRRGHAASTSALLDLAEVAAAGMVRRTWRP